MLFIGDVHGAFRIYHYILFKMQHTGGIKGVPCSFQVGDMGLGFLENDYKYNKDGKAWFPAIGLEHKFIRGNHDEPAMCKKHPNYVGDWVHFLHPDIFAIGGGFSIDKQFREPGVSWWEDEELSDLQFATMLASYKKNKPRIVVSHECPTVIKYKIVTNKEKLKIIGDTERKLQEMYEYHQPEFWIFGHHHARMEIDAGGVHFVGLDELTQCKNLNDCLYSMPELSWE